MKNEIKSICILGVGGVGGYFGGKIAYAISSENNPDLKIYFLARGQHLHEIKKNGLILNTSEETGIICKPTLATDDITKIPSPDLFLVCVKGYDLLTIMKAVKKKIHSNTIILPLLNGVDIYERILEVIDDGVVFPSCVYVGTHIEKPGTVTQKGGSRIITFGPDPRNTDMIPDSLFELFSKFGIQYNWKTDPYPEIWGKYIFIASFGLITAAYNKTIGQVMESDELKERVCAIMNEIVSIAKMKHIDLPDDIVETSLNKGNSFPYETKTSFQRDVEQDGKMNEGDLFGGTLIRLGESLNIPIPAVLSAYEKILKTGRHKKRVS